MTGTVHDADIDAILQRGGEISGTVTGADIGSGVAGICVLMVNPLDHSFAAQVQADDSGRYIRSPTPASTSSTSGTTRSPAP